MTEGTPLSLLDRIRDEGDQAAWREFDGIYRPILRRYAQACRMGPEDVEDVVQHCLATIHKHIEEFQHDAKIGRFRAWLRKIVTNRIRNLVAARSMPTAKTSQLDAAQHRETLPENAFNEIWWNEHLRYYLEEVREDVNDKSYRAFHLHVIEQQSVEQVCSLCDCTPNQLYKIKWRITQKLRDKMRGMIDDER